MLKTIWDEIEEKRTAHQSAAPTVSATRNKPAPAKSAPVKTGLPVSSAGFQWTEGLLKEACKVLGARGGYRKHAPKQAGPSLAPVIATNSGEKVD